jgi:FAD:protein FMN transferase
MKKLSILLIALLILSSCAKKEGLYKETRVIMGTYVTITARESGKSKDELTKAVSDAFAEITKVDELMSTYKRESNLSKINWLSGVTPVQADQEVIDNVEKAIYIGDMTDGAFDVTVGPVVHAWKIGSEQARLPSMDEINKALALVGYKNIVIDKKAGTVFIKKQGGAIDLGGIAKGYASDKAVDSFKKSGIKGGIVAVAGDVKVFGLRPDGKPWGVGIQHPRKEGELMAELPVTDAAVSTSGDYERYFIKDGVRYHHIMDPKTGYPARGLMSVTVLSKDSWLSDSMATGLFVLGPDKAYALAREHPEFEVLMITSEGKVLATGRFKDLKVAKVVGEENK